MARDSLHATRSPTGNRADNGVVNGDGGGFTKNCAGPSVGWPLVLHGGCAEETEMGHFDLSQAAWLRWFDTSARVTT